MKAAIIRIGNSRGIRIPKPILQQCGFGDAVELDVVDRRLVVSAAARRRSGWGELFAAMARYGDDRLVDGPQSASSWDREEWEW